MVSALSLVILGLALLVGGAELVLRGATRFAASVGVKPIVLGITVVAIGTSAPELAVGIVSSQQGNGGLAVGNIAGTNVFNILFILCLSALLKPLPLHTQVLKLELPVTLVSALLMISLSLDGILSQIDGVIFCAVGVVYTAVLIRASRRESETIQEQYDEVFSLDVILRVRKLAHTKVGYFLLLAMGIGLSVLGGSWLVEGAVTIARRLGMSDGMIGLTIVAVGTSAPELVTTVLSTIRGDRDVAVGNLLGSSIYNILFILGLTCLASPQGLPVEKDLLLVDIPLMLCVVIACVPVFISGKQVSRLEGAAGILIYLSYMYWLVFIRTR